MYRTEAGSVEEAGEEEGVEDPQIEAGDVDGDDIPDPGGTPATAGSVPEGCSLAAAPGAGTVRSLWQ